jgi:hypothetical protein
MGNHNEELKEFHFLKEQPDQLVPYLESIRDIDPNGQKRVLTERFEKTDLKKTIKIK